MTLQELNNLRQDQFRMEISKCCGSSNWVDYMTEKLPFASEKKLLSEAESVWQNCMKEDWIEAFSYHPKIGDIENLEKKFASTSKWAEQEQGEMDNSNKEIVQQFARLNQQYENRYGYIFIVFATGKSAQEMMELLENRINNNPEDEIKIAAAEQNKITKLRLQKLLS